MCGARKADKCNRYKSEDKVITAEDGGRRAVGGGGGHWCGLEGAVLAHSPVVADELPATAWPLTNTSQSQFICSQDSTLRHPGGLWSLGP
ncbi:hypothetical protein E2C01_011766 [Portunus trituberculatus]|uniref:Uncharacterized protein n=1 Tax=Portunus trituberculatus TaxID=210409 RepID=A0A5B7DC55_PORTR|nr:hypothetical protein [Portunus trituberculatus]